jgi:hypothetical protein
VKAEQRLSEALQTLARQAQASPDAYARAHVEWRRRERRRRVAAAALAVAVIAAADGAALWALNSGTPDSHIVEQPEQERPEIRIPGQP